MITRRKRQENQAEIKHAADEKDIIENVRLSEIRYSQILSPWEPYIMTLQSLLVWENPQHTAILLIVVNFVFWLATTLRFYYMVGLVGFFTVFLDMWWGRIWPEIRVPPPPGEDQEGWTPVHPQLLSVPELSHYCAKIWVTSTSSVQWAISLRKQSRAKFFLLMSTIFTSLAFFGSRISGIFLCYITVMSFLVIPPLIYHSILQEVYKKIEPHIFRFEKTFNIKRKKRTRKVKKKSGLEDSTLSVTSQGSDTEDEILNEFVPSPHPSLLSTLHKAAGRDSDDDHTPSRLTPEKMSRGPSRDHSDNESHEDMLSFSQDLSEIPSYDDSRLEDSLGDPGSLASLRTIPDYDQLDRGFKNDPDLDLDETLTETRSEVMHFKDSHFKESSESGGDEGPLEVEHLAEGLESMPDVEDVLDHEQQESESNRATLLGQAQAMIASDVMAQTMSNLMTSTMTGLTYLGETVRTAAASGMGSNEQPPGGHPVHYRSGSDETNINLGRRGRGQLTESMDSDGLLEEFEFLEEEDLDVMDVDRNRKAKRE